jgi:ketosteroid isomerase-like protein
VRQARAVYSADAKIWRERLDHYPSCQEEAIFEMNEKAGRIKDEFAINGLLEALTKALHDKKARALIALLSNDAVAFDLAPPLQLGPNVMHDPAPLEEWFATWRGPIVSAPFYRTIVVGGDVAYAYGLQHMTGTKVDGENADLWFRTTACFSREGERWLITHMHNSVPFAMDGTDKALVDLKPQS